MVTSRGRGEHPVEDLRLAADVELGGRLVEQHQLGAAAYGTQRPGQRHPLPLAAGQVGAARVALGQRRCPGRPAAVGARRRPGPPVRRRRSASPAGSTFSRRLSSNRTKSWKTAVSPLPPVRQVEVCRRSTPSTSIAPVVGVVEPAQQLGQGGLAGPVLADDGQRGARRARPGRGRRRPAGRCPGSGSRRRGGPARVAGRGRPADRRRCSAPSGAIAGSSRSTAATGAAAPSSAQLRPPNATRLTPSATWAKTTIGSSVQLARHGRHAERAEHGQVGDRRRSPGTARRSVPAAGSRGTAARTARCRRSMKRSTTQPASPNSRSSLAGWGSTASRYA